MGSIFFPNFIENFSHPRHTRHTSAVCAALCTNHDKTAPSSTSTHTPARPSPTTRLATHSHQRSHPQADPSASSIKTASSPASTPFNTVTDLSPSVVLRNTALGTVARTMPAADAEGLHGDGCQSVAISFQDGRRRPTVVLRLPLRWGSPRGGPGAGLGLLVGEGTLWTQRRQELASPT